MVTAIIAAGAAIVAALLTQITSLVAPWLTHRFSSRAERRRAFADYQIETLTDLQADLQKWWRLLTAVITVTDRKVDLNPALDAYSHVAMIQSRVASDALRGDVGAFLAKHSQLASSQPRANRDAIHQGRDDLRDLQLRLGREVEFWHVTAIGGRRLSIEKRPTGSRSE